MKVFLLIGLFFLANHSSERASCDDLIINTTVINTSLGKNNGKVEVQVQKGNPPYKVNLFAEKKENNKLDIKFKDLQNLPAGKYILIVQHSGECVYQQTFSIN